MFLYLGLIAPHISRNLNGQFCELVYKADISIAFNRKPFIKLKYYIAYLIARVLAAAIFGKRIPT